MNSLFRDSLRPTLCRSFLYTAGTVLAGTGLAKVLSVFGSALVLRMAEPVFGVRFRDLLLAAGLAELVVAYLCLLTHAVRVSAFLVAWLATNFLIYRLSLWFLGWHRPCPCLGNLTEVIHISSVAADHVIKVLLAYLLVGGYSSLFCLWRERRAWRGGQI